MKLFYFILFSIFTLISNNAQTILFSEDFDDETITDMTGTSSQGISWTASCPFCASGDIFEVNTFGAVAQGLKGNDTNGPATFTASGIDATGMHVLVLEFDYESDAWSSLGNLECSSECPGCSGDPADILSPACDNCWDFLQWEISTGTFSDGGIVIGNDCTIGTTGHVISNPGCSSPYDASGILIPGNDPANLTVTITMAMWASDEEMIIDNVVIIGYTKSEAINAGIIEDAGDDNTVDLCASSGTANLFDGILGSPATTGIWDGPSTTTGGHLGTLDLSNFSTGDYYYITSSTGAGCQDTAVITVISTGTAPVASVTGVQDICTGDIITVTGSGSGSYTWSDNSTGSTLTITSPGSYSLTVSDNCGTDTESFTIGNLGSPPVGTLTGNQFVCDPNTSTSLLISGGTTYEWSTGNTSNSETFNPGDNGYVLIYNQCGQDSIPFTILDESVIASFTMSDTIGEEPLTIYYTNNSVNASIFEWNFDNGNTSNSTNASTEYELNGTYQVALIAENGAGCSDTTYATVYVLDPAPLIIPNIFTPNMDDINDEFRVSHGSVVSFYGTIYNRWGQKMFQNTEEIFIWDGRNNSGKAAPDGTYYYTIEATFKNGETQSFSGPIQLIR